MASLKWKSSNIFKFMDTYLVLTEIYGLILVKRSKQWPMSNAADLRKVLTLEGWKLSQLLFAPIEWVERSVASRIRSAKANIVYHAGRILETCEPPPAAARS